MTKTNKRRIDVAKKLRAAKKMSPKRYRAFKKTGAKRKITFV